MIRSNRTIVTSEDVQAKDYGLSNVRFSKTGIKRFLKGETINGFDLLLRLEAFIRRFVVIGDDLAFLVATWICGTYLYQVFEYFPYLVLRSPEKRCGKSLVLDLISLLAFNAHPPTASPTEAQIFREPREDGGVQIYDELEGMTGDKERWSAVTSVLNVGFHRGAVVSRYRRTKEGQQKESFETYVPRAVASISALETTLEDRGIMIVMHRLLPGQQTERFSLRRLNTEAQILRDDLYLFALVSAPAMAAVYDDTVFVDLHALDHRAIDLWEPLLSIAAVIDAGTSTPNLYPRLITIAHQLGAQREQRASDDVVPSILDVLDECLSLGSEIRIPTEDLIEKVKKRMGWDSLTPKALANRLHPLGLKSKSGREGGRVIRGYTVTRQQLDDLKRRYIPEGNATSATHATVNG